MTTEQFQTVKCIRVVITVKEELLFSVALSERATENSNVPERILKKQTKTHKYLIDSSFISVLVSFTMNLPVKLRPLCVYATACWSDRGAVLFLKCGHAATRPGLPSMYTGGNKWYRVARPVQAEEVNKWRIPVRNYGYTAISDQ